MRVVSGEELCARLDAIDRKFAPPVCIQKDTLNLITGTSVQGRFSTHYSETKLSEVKPNWIIYDCEIIKAIPQIKESLKKGIDYCDGWTDFKGMGVAVIGYKINHEPAKHCEDVEDFKKVLEGFEGAIVGFNSTRFDDRLLRAHGLGLTTTYDLLDEIKYQVGFASSHGKDSKDAISPKLKPLKGLSYPKGKKRSYKLDSLAQANGLNTKSMHGGMAPIQWQKGNYQQVIDYCLGDVEVTSQLLDLGLMGKLTDPNTGKSILLTNPPSCRADLLEVVNEEFVQDLVEGIKRAERLSDFGIDAVEDDE
jgi:hypothetical protein